MNPAATPSPSWQFSARKHVTGRPLPVVAASDPLVELVEPPLIDRVVELVLVEEVVVAAVEVGAMLVVGAPDVDGKLRGGRVVVGVDVETATVDDVLVSGGALLSEAGDEVVVVANGWVVVVVDVLGAGREVVVDAWQESTLPVKVRSNWVGLPVSRLASITTDQV